MSRSEFTEVWRKADSTKPVHLIKVWDGGEGEREVERDGKVEKALPLLCSHHIFAITHTKHD